MPQIERTAVRIAQASDDAKTTAATFAPVEACGMLTDMAESQWLITSPEGKILSSEAFELVWNSGDPAYRSMLTLRSVTTGAVILRIEVDRSHQYVIATAPSYESSVYKPAANGDLLPAHRIEIHQMRRVTPDKVTTERRDLKTGGWQVVYNYLRIADPEEQIATASPVETTPVTPEPESEPASTYDSSLASVPLGYTNDYSYGSGTPDSDAYSNTSIR